MLPSPMERKVAAVVSSPLFVAAAAFGVRLIFLWLSHYHEDRSHPTFETVGLEAKLLALSLAHGKGFSGPYPGYDLITACIAPVYPFLWAAGIKLLHLGSFGATLFAQVMNSAFSAATGWPIFAIGKRVFGEKIGLASAWLWALFPYSILLALEWTWDQSLAALTLALVVSATFSLAESMSPVAWTGYGLLWGFAALVNPTLCLLLPFFLGWLIIRRGGFRGPAFALAARAVVVFVLAVLPWTIRNYFAIDGVVFVKSNFGLEFWLGNNPAVKDVYAPELHPASNASERLLLVFTGEPNYNRAKERQAVSYIEKNPHAFLKNLFDRFLDTWAATYDSRVDPWILALHLSRADVWFCAAFSILSFAGLILALRSNWPDSLPLAMCLVLFPIPYYITHTALRYRHPIDPFMTIFTAYAVAHFTAFVKGIPAIALPSRARNQYESISPQRQGHPCGATLL
jgi:4-amino-4-deoxy-L-arabinose transferase-like glycosyltransferase